MTVSGSQVGLPGEQSPTRVTNLEHVSARATGRARILSFVGDVALYVLLTAIALACLAPFYFMLVGSLMDRRELFGLTPTFWPERFVWENYQNLFDRFPFFTYIRNSMIVSVGQTLGTVLVCSLAGYVFAKRTFPGRDRLFFVVLLTSILPSGQITIIPFYLLMVKFGWIDTFWPLIVPWWAPPLSIFLMRQYIAAGVPDELLDAARLDGETMLGAYWRIVLPLVTPGLIVIGILQFISIWNEFVYGLLVLKSDEMRTVTVALAELSRRTQQGTLYGPLFGGIVLATIPTILLYFLFQRRLTQGILSGALRG